MKARSHNANDRKGEHHAGQGHQDIHQPHERRIDCTPRLAVFAELHEHFGHAKLGHPKAIFHRIQAIDLE